MRRIVITGLGMVTALGHDVSRTWENILAGKSGVTTVDHFDSSEFSCRISASVRDLNLNGYLTPKEARRNDTFIHYGIVAAKQAIFAPSRYWTLDK